MTTQFAILHHVTNQGEHWDLMLERGGVLLTWQMEQLPGQSTPFPINVKRLPDHRAHYLTYEGAISGDRGTVHRVDQGTVTVEELTDSVCVFRLSGGKLTGRLQLAWDESGGTLQEAS